MMMNQRRQQDRRPLAGRRNHIGWLCLPFDTPALSVWVGGAVESIGMSHPKLIGRRPIALRTPIHAKLIRDAVRGVRAAGAVGIGDRVRIKFVREEIAKILGAGPEWKRQMKDEQCDSQDGASMVRPYPAV